VHRALTSLIVLLLLNAPADAADRVRVGVELTFFQAAAPIATALAAGQINVGVAPLQAISAALEALRGRFMKAPIPLREIVDTSFVEAAIKELDASSARPSGTEVPRR